MSKVWRHVLHRNWGSGGRRKKLPGSGNEKQGRNLPSLWELCISLEKGGKRVLFSGDSQFFMKQGQVPLKAEVEDLGRFSGDRPKVAGVTVGGPGAERGGRSVRLGIYKVTLWRKVFWVATPWEGFSEWNPVMNFWVGPPWTGLMGLFLVSLEKMSLQLGIGLLQPS